MNTSQKEFIPGLLSGDKGLETRGLLAIGSVAHRNCSSIIFTGVFSI
jgi:hypothetical protein